MSTILYWNSSKIEINVHGWSENVLFAPWLVSYFVWKYFIICVELDSQFAPVLICHNNFMKFDYGKTIIKVYSSNFKHTPPRTQSATVVY